MHELVCQPNTSTLAVQKHHRARHTTPLLTVSNHVSTIDDGLLTSCLVPLAESLWDPVCAGQRWSLCTERACKIDSLFGAFTGAGQTVPIKLGRGGGLNQPSLEVFADRLVPGEWLNVYPEGVRSRGL
jgi:1-acyl-sn-glycerol-3-phosphate acyltransferase